MNYKTVSEMAVLSVALLAADLGQAGDSKTYFRDEDATAYATGVSSITNVQQNGELYALTWPGDIHLDRLLAANCSNSTQVLGFLCKKVLDNAPLPNIVTGFGCSSFAATNSAGQSLVGRNFDYRYSMAHILLFSPRNANAGRTYASIGTVDGGFAGYDVGSLTNITDQTRADYPWHAALFPFLCMDGMNEAGFTVSVLSLDGRPDSGGNKTRVIEQFVPGHTNIVPSVAIRYLLDRAGSTAEGVAMLTNFNMFASSGPGMAVQANYHFLLNDRNGDARVVEWLPPAHAGESWIPFVTNATAVSNFYLADGYGHGSNRWEILRHALACRQGTLEESDAMNLCRAAAQKKGAEQTSWTHWSIVYNLADLTANIATLGNYDEIFPYSITADALTIGAAKSARPSVETNLPPFNQFRLESGKVYLNAEDSIPSFQSESEVSPCAWVSAVMRSGCACDSSLPIVSRIVKAYFGHNRSLIYVASPAPFAESAQWTDDAVCGTNEKGVSAHVAHFRTTTGTGSRPASCALCQALINCTGGSAVDYVQYLNAEKPHTDGTGVIFTDAKGNVAVWPNDAELAADDASEMIRNSLDLRKGIYEIDGEERGQFDELPGLLSLAASTNATAIVSMGYGHLDVVLPETNLIWRAKIENADSPHYGIITDASSIAHVSAATLAYADGRTVERNNQGRLVAEVGSELKVTYAAESGYYFANGTDRTTFSFTAGEMTTTPPTETPGQYAPSLQLGIVAQRYPWNGLLDVQYWAKFIPDSGYNIVVSVTLPDGTEKTETHAARNGQHATTFDAKAAFGPYLRKDVKVRAKLEKAY